MAERRFVHLHCHSHYSLLDGASRIPELVETVKQHGMNAIALTDHGNLYGAIEFYRECKAAGLNPIIGYEAYVAPGKRTEREARRRGEAGFHLTLLAKNIIGFRNLIKMSSIAFLEGYYYVPRIDKEVLERHHEGIICLSGCASAEFSEFIIKGQMQEAEELAAWFARLFGKDFYVEIQNNGVAIQKQCADGAIAVANKLGLPLVATSDAHYLRQEDAPAHDVLLCINTRKSRSDTNRMRFDTDQFHIRPPKEIYQLFPGHEEAVRRSQEIADGCNIEIDFNKRHFPVFLPPEQKTAEQYLRELCEVGLRERYGDAPSKQVLDRFEHELAIINKLGFASYFLIVWDFVRFAQDNGIPASARGSACGALVSYVLKLSHVDPLEYDLLFERFLDPNRKEAPDIDIDFCQERREEVIAYVRRKYGEQSVAQIATFGTMAARAAIKDVGRVLEVPLEHVNKLTNFIPKILGITIDDALQQSPDLRQAYETDPKTRELIDIARRLEGTNRNAGTHAAGVVIANGPLTDYVPVHRVLSRDDGGARSDEAVVTTQWVMGDLEKVGLLKMDFLGLRTLTLLDNCVRLIEKTRGEKIDLNKLPLDDAETYKLLQRGDAKGVFQLESEGIRELLKRMRPDNIRDIIALMALYRPGPLGGGMVDAYINCKHGREKPQYAHPVMEEILSETFGVMCIQEDTRISLADGSEKPIREVRRGDLVHSLNYDTNRFEIKECHGCGPTRRCDGLRITLENGFAVTLTDDHKVLTFDGMKRADELNPESELVAIALSLRQEGETISGLAPWLGTDEDVAYLMGILVGDGCLTTSGVTVATGTEPNHRRLILWVEEHLPRLHLHSYFHFRSWYLCVSCDELLNEPGYGNRKTKLHYFLETHGLKVRAQLKRVPGIIFRSSGSVRAAFLAGLFDSDGCLAKTNRGSGMAFLSSASPGLLQDVRRLCQLEGLAVRVTEQRIQVWNVKGLQGLLQPYLVIKHFVGKPTAGVTFGKIPRERVFAAIPAGESIRAFCRRTGIERRGLRHTHPFVKASTARKAGIEFQDVRYLRISSIERVTDQQFYGMSVADHHNLVANGIVVKNCYQEQVMRILNRLGGIELSSAYQCIKAISKKKHDIINQRKVEFLKGTKERGVSDEVSEDIFEKIVFFGGYGFNKCLVGSTRIVDAVSGVTYTIGTLFRNRRPFTIHALGENGKLRLRRVTDVIWNGRKPVFRLRTQRGNDVTATANHPFQTRDGWVTLDKLRPGDRIAAADRLQVNALIVWDEIVAITPAGIDDTYDLTVEEDHNFVAEGLIVHNSHSAAYAQVGYQTAYLKTHYTPEFMAALLTSEIEDGNKRDIMVEHFEDARKLGYPVQPPNVNEDLPDFTVVRNRLLFGLVAIKGLGRGAASEIVRARAEKGPFKDIFNLCERIDHRLVSKASLEKLIKAGALDCLGARRAQLMAVLPRAMDSAQALQQDRRLGQMNLFESFEGDGGAVAPAIAEVLPDVAEWPPVEKLKYEKEALDFYVSSHPLAQHEELIARFSTHGIKDLVNVEAGREVLIGGMLTQVRLMNYKKVRNGNNRYVRCKLEDFNGSIECVMWGEEYVRYKDKVAEDQICFVGAVVEKERDQPSLQITRLVDLEQAQKERTTGVWILLFLEEHDENHLRVVERSLRRAPGKCPVFVRLQDRSGRCCDLKVSQELSINPTTFPKAELEDVLGKGRVVFSRHANGNGR